MNILFLDDSGQRTRQKFVCVGGVIFRDIYIKDVCTSFSETKRLQGIPADEEVKWHPDDNSWIAKNLKGQRRILVYSALLSLVQRFNGSILLLL